VKLERIYFRGFGKYVDRTFELEPGLNLFEAPNEAGKSTLIHGLTALLYGVKKEGISRRQKADYYDRHLPWESRHYGGEVDFSLQGKQYRIIRNLLWEEEREQLVDRKTGRDLTELYPLDRRKDRNLLEKLIGLNRSLFLRVAYISPYSLAGEKQLVDRIRQLVTQGEEQDLAPVLERLEQEIQRIGKSPLARSKPYGAAVNRVEVLEKNVRDLRASYEELRKDQSRLSRMQQELAEETKRWEACRQRANQLRQQVRLLDRLATLQEKQKHFSYKQQTLTELEKKRAALKEQRDHLAPPVVLSPEEMDAMNKLLNEREVPRIRLETLREERNDLAQKLATIRREQAGFLAEDVSQVERQKHLLEEVVRLQQSLITPVAQETMDEKVTAMRLEKDHQRLQELQEREEDLRRRRRELEDRHYSYKARLEGWEREHFLRQATQVTVNEPARPSRNWLWGGIGTTVLGILILKDTPVLGLLALGVAGFAFFRYRKQRLLDQQVRQEWQERQQRLQAEWARLKEEQKKNQQNVPELDYDSLLAQTAEIKEQLHQLYDELALIIQEQEAIFERWQASSAAELYRKVEQQRLKVKEREAAKKRDKEYRARIAELQEELEHWGERFRSRLGSFEAERWLEEISRMADEARAAREQVQKLELELSAKQEEEGRLLAALDRLQEEEAAWSERLGTDDAEEWAEWLKRSGEVHRLNRQLESLEQEWEDLMRVKQREGWDIQLAEVQEEMQALEKESESFAANQEQEGENIRDLLARAEADLEEAEAVYREKEAEVLKLEERIRTQYGQLPPLGDVETRWQEARRQVRDLEKERTALETAREVLQEAVQEVQEDLAPRLAPHASRWIAGVTGGRYQDLLIDPADGLSLSVFTPETGARQPVENLSQGTVDQMYFAMRLALIHFFSETSDIRLPVILDDSLVHFDDDRLRPALKILGEMAQDHQVILCTCQSREKKVLEEEGIPFVRQVV
jgi:DNA repair exonuclease SbcCD ATPase subunit